MNGLEARHGSVLRLAMPRGRAWAKAVAAGALSAVCAVALLAASGYLITRAAEHPPILYLTLVMVGVRAFALGRAALRYVDRLAGHDASFRQLAVVRTETYRRLASVAPAGLGSTGRGDLLTRLVTDTDRLRITADLEYWRAAVVVLVPNSRNGDLLLASLTDALGPPKSVGGVQIWEVSPPSG